MASKSAKKPPTVADIERLKASRRVALERAASQIQKAKSQKQEAEARSEGERQKREAEAARKAHALRSAAAARGSIVAAEKKQRERQLELVRQAEAEAKRERVAAVLAYDEAQADERERRVRNETYARIRREERRRELALQRQEDERVEMMRMYEAGERYKGASPVATMIPAPVPAVHSARSFFSITDSAVSECCEASKQPWRCEFNRRTLNVSRVSFCENLASRSSHAVCVQSCRYGIPCILLTLACSTSGI